MPFVSFYSLWLRERRGFVGFCRPCCVVIGRALVLCSHFHYWLLGLVFPAGQRDGCAAKMATDYLFYLFEQLAWLPQWVQYCGINTIFTFQQIFLFISHHLQTFYFSIFSQHTVFCVVYCSIMQIYIYIFLFSQNIYCYIF